MSESGDIPEKHQGSPKKVERLAESRGGETQQTGCFEYAKKRNPWREQGKQKGDANCGGKKGAGVRAQVSEEKGGYGEVYADKPNTEPLLETHSPKATQEETESLNSLPSVKEMQSKTSSRSSPYLTCCQRLSARDKVGPRPCSLLSLLRPWTKQSRRRRDPRSPSAPEAPPRRAASGSPTPHGRRRRRPLTGE